MEKPFNSAAWFNWQQPASPFLLGPTVDACGEPFRRMFGFPFFTSVVFYRTLADDRGYHASWLLRLDEGRACGRLLHDLLAVPSFRPWFDDLLHSAFTDVDEASSAISSTDLVALSDSALSELFTSFYLTFVDFYKLGAITEPVQWRAEEVFRWYTAQSERTGHAVAPEGWDTERIERAAFAMSDEPYTRGIDRDLMAVAQAVDAALAEHSDATSVPSQHADVLAQSASTMRAAADHADRFSWKANNYREVSVLGPDDIVAEVLALDLVAGSRAEGIRQHAMSAQRRGEGAASGSSC